MSRKTLFVTAFCAIAIAAPALAGEVNGSTKNPKDDFNNGRSICSFSGLNDFPDGSQSGPHGHTQSYGQDVRAGRADPVGDKFEHPGFLCNPNNLSLKDVGHP
jgi:hypothetical protein